MGAVVGFIARLVPGMDKAVFQIAVDMVFADKGVEAGLGILRYIPELTRGVYTEDIRHFFWIDTLAGMNLPAIASGGAGADPG